MSGLTDPQKDMTVITFLIVYLLGVGGLVVMEYIHRQHELEFQSEIAGKFSDGYDAVF